MSILGWLLFGLIVGAIAKFLMPGNDPGGWIVTILLGIAGSFVGGFLASALLGRQEQTAGWIGSLIRAIFPLFIYSPLFGPPAVGLKPFPPWGLARPGGGFFFSHSFHG